MSKSNSPAQKRLMKRLKRIHTQDPTHPAFKFRRKKQKLTLRDKQNINDYMPHHISQPDQDSRH